MQTGTVGNRNFQFQSAVAHKIQNTNPLLFRQNIQVACRNGTVRIFTIKIVISLGCPSAGNTAPGSTQFLRQLTQLRIVQINRRIQLHQIFVHCGNAVCRGLHIKRLRTGNLLGCICLPESTASHFCELHIVAHQVRILLMQEFYFARIQFHKFCHKNTPFFVTKKTVT